MAKRTTLRSNTMVVPEWKKKSKREEREDLKVGPQTGDSDDFSYVPVRHIYCPSMTKKKLLAVRDVIIANEFINFK